MPHGRPRKKRTWSRKRDRVALSRTPVGYESWLRFVADHFEIQPYHVSSPRGLVEIQHQDRDGVRKVLHREYWELVMLAEEGVEYELHDLIRNFGDRALYYLWEGVTKGMSKMPLRLGFIRRMTVLVKFSQEWPVYCKSGELDWVPLAEWKETYSRWVNPPVNP